ncbi:MAG: putative quinol monooxygenase [Mycobacterium sp.]
MVKFAVGDEYQDSWLAATKDFTEATRAEPGSLWREGSRNVDTPSEFVLVDGLRGQRAEVEHDLGECVPQFRRQRLRRRSGVVA